MKKTLIAGAASVALAAMPVLGVFAASTGGPFTDKLSVTIDNACTFSRGSTAHTNGTPGAWTTGETADVLAGNLAAGGIKTDFGSSSFNVICNNEAGWKVTADATPLTGTTTDSEKIPLGSPVADTAAWNYTSSSSDTDAATAFVQEYFKAHTGATDEVVAQSGQTTATAGRNFKVVYGVSVDHKLSAQTYEGTITYEFAQL